MPSELTQLHHQIRSCRLCAEHLPLGPRPVLVPSASAKVLIIGQAPGTRVHASGVPWDDPSGDRLREWLGLDKDRFYDPALIAIVPMGFCYPGKGKGGDLPPRPECAPTWHPPLLALMPQIELVMLIGRYAQQHYLPQHKALSLTELVRSQPLDGRFLATPHPSPRNRRWLTVNAWFEAKVVPTIRRRVQELLPE